jgi:hypothetical protein
MRTNRHAQWLFSLCQAAETALGESCSENAYALDQVLQEMTSLAQMMRQPAPKGLRRIIALRSGLDRVRPADRMLVAHKAVLIMWDVYFSLVKSLSAITRTPSAWRRAAPFATICLAVLAVVGAFILGRDYVVRDAASLIHYDFMRGSSQKTAFSGIHGVEYDGERSWRWIDGPMACMHVPMPKARKATLRFSVMNPIVGQHMTLQVNGRTVLEFKDMPLGSWTNTQSGEVVVDLVRGTNILCFSTSKYNHNGFTFAETDPSPYALAFTQVSLDAIP